MARSGAIGATTKFSQIIHVSCEFAWPMNWYKLDSHASNHFTIVTVFEIFGRGESSFFLGSWIVFHCTEKLMMQGYHLMLPAVSGQLFRS